MKGQKYFQQEDILQLTAISLSDVLKENHANLSVIKTSFLKPKLTVIL
jgi:hypothetical protein